MCVIKKKSNLLAPEWGSNTRPAVSIGHTGLAHIWVTNVVVGLISPMILVFRANVRGQWVRKVIIDYTVHQASYHA